MKVCVLAPADGAGMSHTALVGDKICQGYKGSGSQSEMERCHLIPHWFVGPSAGGKSENLHWCSRIENIRMSAAEIACRDKVEVGDHLITQTVVMPEGTAQLFQKCERGKSVLEIGAGPQVLRPLPCAPNPREFVCHASYITGRGCWSWYVGERIGEAKNPGPQKKQNRRFQALRKEVREPPRLPRSRSFGTQTRGRPQSEHQGTSINYTVTQDDWDDDVSVAMTVVGLGRHEVEDILGQTASEIDWRVRGNASPTQAASSSHGTLPSGFSEGTQVESHWQLIEMQRQSQQQIQTLQAVVQTQTQQIAALMQRDQGFLSRQWGERGRSSQGFPPWRTTAHFEPYCPEPNTGFGQPSLSGHQSPYRHFRASAGSQEERGVNPERIDIMRTDNPHQQGSDAILGTEQYGRSRRRTRAQATAAKQRARNTETQSDSKTPEARASNLRLKQSRGYDGHEVAIDRIHCHCGQTHSSSVLDDTHFGDKSCASDALVDGWLRSDIESFRMKSDVWKQGNIHHKLYEAYREAYELPDDYDLVPGSIVAYKNSFLKVSYCRNGVVTLYKGSSVVHALKSDVRWFKAGFDGFRPDEIPTPKDLDDAVRAFLAKSEVPSLSLYKVIVHLIGLPTTIHTAQECFRYMTKLEMSDVNVYFSDGHAVAVDPLYYPSTTEYPSSLQRTP